MAGKVNRIIADEPEIAERTVKVHRAQPMTKLDVSLAVEFGGLAEQLRRLSD